MLSHEKNCITFLPVAVSAAIAIFGLDGLPLTPFHSLNCWWYSAVSTAIGVVAACVQSLILNMTSRRKSSGNSASPMPFPSSSHFTTRWCSATEASLVILVASSSFSGATFLMAFTPSAILERIISSISSVSVSTTVPSSPVKAVIFAFSSIATLTSLIILLSVTCIAAPFNLPEGGFVNLLRWLLC